jgi:hypothetical protein
VNLAVAFPTWLQVGSTVAAAAAAGASWIAVVQARRIAQEAREAEAEALLPLLLVSLNFNLPGAGRPTMGVALYNAGGSVAKNVAVLLIAEDAYARQVVGFLRPGETVTLGSELPATDAARAVAYARSQDGRDVVWDHEGERRELEHPPSGWPVWDAIFEVFYPDEDLSGHRPTNLLRGRRPALLNCD